MVQSVRRLAYLFNCCGIDALDAEPSHSRELHETHAFSAEISSHQGPGYENYSLEHATQGIDMLEDNQTEHTTVALRPQLSLVMYINPHSRSKRSL